LNANFLDSLIDDFLKSIENFVKTKVLIMSRSFRNFGSRISPKNNVMADLAWAPVAMTVLNQRLQKFANESK
jgi:hypothetical protein